MSNGTLNYQGHVGASLGPMSQAYVPTFVSWINWRIGIEGTLQRPPYSLKMGKDWVENLANEKGKHEVFAVLAHEKNGRRRYVGHMGIHNINKDHGFATSGSMIGAKGAQGRGIGTEAKLLILYHAFMVIGLRKVCSTVKAWNGQSMGHLLKCGYQVCGRHRKHHFHEGAFGDEILLEVFREEWEPIWNAYQKTKMLPKLSSEQRKRIEQEIAA